MVSDVYAYPFQQKVKATEIEIELADLFVNYLQQLSVEYVFGIPGGAIEPLYDALARSERQGGLRPIVARHETGAAFMADGYAVQTGNLGVCCATTGPGATNLVTGVCSAFENGVPMLVITAQTMMKNFGRGAFQESSCTGVNTVSMFQHCTHYNSFISHPDQFEHKLVSAITKAYQAKGPTHLSIPLDIFRAQVQRDQDYYDLSDLIRSPQLLDLAAVASLIETIKKAGKVVFVLGEGCHQAIGEIVELAHILGAPIVTTPHGKGVISPYHPLYRGVIGFAGHVTANEVLMDEDVDLVVAVGTSLSEWATDNWNSSALMNERLVHIDSAADNFMRSPMAKLHVLGDITTVSSHLLNALQVEASNVRSFDGSNPIMGDGPKPESPIEVMHHFSMDQLDKWWDDSTPIKPQRLMHDLAQLFPANTRYFADTGNSMSWTIHYLHPYERQAVGDGRDKNRSYRTCLEFASMGWAIGAAVGAALGDREAPAVCITGDGSMLMNGHEFTVAVEEKLPVIFVVLNDQALGMVKHGQRLGGAEPIGYELPTMDFAAYAKLAGGEGIAIHSPDDLALLDVNALLNRDGPTILDVYIDPEETPPMGMRTRLLQSRE